MKNIIIGVVLVLAAAGIIIGFSVSGHAGPAAGSDTVKIYYGSEKAGLLADKEVQSILSDKYHLTVDGAKVGSITMVQGPTDGLDGLWPSSELAAQIYDARAPGAKQQTLFRTPLVLYSWPEITDALIKAGVVRLREGVYYVIDMRKYVSMIAGQTTWKSLGLDGMNGTVSLRSTSPAESNSGFLISGLVSVILNGDQIPDDASLPKVLPTIKGMYQRLGYLEPSTGILFDNYIAQGMGAYPVIVGYESQIIEYAQNHQQLKDKVKSLLRVLVPEPTVWSGHPFIALTAKGQRLLAALQDDRLLTIAWERYGFRTGAAGLNLDTSILKTLGLPDQITNVLPLPAPKTMEQIINAVQ